MKRVYSVKQAANYLGVSENTIRRLIELKRLPAKLVSGKTEGEESAGRKGKTGVWRIKREWIDVYLNDGTDLEQIVKDYNKIEGLDDDEEDEDL